MALSLQRTLKNCKVKTEDAVRYQSERFLNPKEVICSQYKFRDDFGRNVSFSPYNLNHAGCNSPLNIVDVENLHRPPYHQYVSMKNEIEPNQMAINQHEGPLAFPGVISPEDSAMLNGVGKQIHGLIKPSCQNYHRGQQMLHQPL